MLAVIAAHFLAALVAPALVGRLGRRAFLLLALVPLSAFGYALAQTGHVLDGDPVGGTLTWVPGFDLDLTWRMDTLAWLMVLVVGGVGALVFAYCQSYFSSDAKGLGRFAGVLTAFAGSMLGVVTADDTILLYVFWELTSVFSYLLIGHAFERQASRRAANQAIMVTTAGGLAMLAGLVILGEVDGGSYQLSTLVASAADGGIALTSPLVSTALVLVFLGAATKSALVPWHFWLPAAMAAPTPVSAYLHAAAMVKAGVYLVARLTPGLADVALWHWLTAIVGGATLLVGGYRALRQNDLKLILAYGTVSQLGMLILLLGDGRSGVALAGIAMLLAHVLFKACLFLTAGIVDMCTGTRDIRELSGVGRSLPIAAASAALAAASMAGVPLLAGYVAKEAALASLVHEGDLTAAIGIALGAALTVAYSLRFWFGAFGRRAGIPTTPLRQRPRFIVVPPAILAVASLVVGVLPAIEERYLAPYALTVPGEAGHLTLWAGWELPLWLTVGALGLGTLLFVARDRVERAQAAVPRIPSADGVYRGSLVGLENLAADVTAFTQRGSLPAYQVIIIVVMVLAGGGTALAAGVWPDAVRISDWWGQVLIALTVAVTAVMVARSRRRLKAVVLLGVVGYGMALLFALHGAPDLALTQVMVETITLVLFVLVLRRLPAYFSNRPLTGDRWGRVAVAVLAGATVSVLGLVAVAGRVATPVSEGFPDLTYEHGYGRNIVNVVLVDTRAWDTFGEISVLLVAATGVASLLFLRDRAGIVDSARNRLSTQSSSEVWGRGVPDLGAPLRRAASPEPPAWVRSPRRGQRWLAGVSSLAPRRRSVIFEVGARLVFHSMILVSLYLLFAGHNQPGGGFAGGLMAGTALVVRYLAGGRYEIGATIPLHAGYLLGGGLVIAAGAALAPLLAGGTVLQTFVIDLTVPVYGDVHLASALFFDVGVYVLVVGLVLDVLRSLGAEIVRHGELEGVDDAADDPDDAGATETGATANPGAREVRR